MPTIKEIIQKVKDLPHFRTLGTQSLPLQFQPRITTGEVKSLVHRIEYLQALLPTFPNYRPLESVTSLPSVNRLEVIDATGRAFVRRDINLKSSFQDGGQTLIIFINNKYTNPIEIKDEALKTALEVIKQLSRVAKINIPNIDSLFADNVASIREALNKGE